MADDLVKQFCEESTDRLRSFASHLLAIERGQESEQRFAEMLRQLHSLKGSSRMLGLTEIGEALHTTEDLVSLLRGKPHELVMEAINPLLKVCDSLQDSLVEIHRGEADHRLEAVGDTLRELMERLGRDGSEALAALSRAEPEIFAVLNRHQKETLTRGLKEMPLIHVIVLSFRRETFASQVRRVHDILSGNGMLISTTGTTHAPADGYDLAFIFLMLSSQPLPVVMAPLAEHAPVGRSLGRSAEDGTFRYLTTADDPEAVSPSAAAVSIAGEAVPQPGAEGAPPSKDIPSFVADHVDGLRAQSYNEEFQRLQEWFLDEGQENLKHLYALILSYEKQQSAETINSIFRSFHNLKGSGGSYKFGCISRTAHALESYVQSLRTQDAAVTIDVINTMMYGVDVLEEMFAACKQQRQNDPALRTIEESLVERLKQAPTSAPASGRGNSSGVGEPRKSMAADTLRIERRKLDSIVNSAVELSVAHHTEQHVMSSIASVFSQHKQIVQQWQGMHEAIAMVAGGNEALQQLMTDFSSLLTSSHHQLRDLNRIIETNLFTWNTLAFLLRADVLELHLQPLSTLFESADRIARDLMLALGKDVQLVIDGGGIEVDRRIIETLRDPMVHLLRNAIDHGIETPAQRERSGKPAQGKVTITAQQMGFVFMISVSDDGSGINHAALAAKAAEAGIATPEEIGQMTDGERCSLLFRHGFSTRKTVDAISGRGVGLDIVATNVDALGGAVSVSSITGQGTVFEITLPTTLTTTRVVVLEIDGRSFTVPVAYLEQIVLLHPEMVQTCSGKRVLPYRDSLLPVYDLEDVLHTPRSTIRLRKGLIIRTTGTSLCLSIPHIVDELELITRPMPTLCRPNPLFSGANILPDGSIALLLSPQAIAGISTQSARADQRTTRKKRHLLVVDDSLIARELMKNILIGTGYQVSLARDGQDGLFFLRTHSVDMVLSDIDMPVMDGVSFLRAVKRDPLFRNIPVVMFTSQDDEAQRENCLGAGATAYITKGAFNQNNLLATVHRILSDGQP